jgi:hypothetical protein
MTGPDDEAAAWAALAKISKNTVDHQKNISRLVFSPGCLKRSLRAVLRARR